MAAEPYYGPQTLTQTLSQLIEDVRPPFDSQRIWRAIHENRELLDDYDTRKFLDRAARMYLEELTDAIGRLHAANRVTIANLMGGQYQAYVHELMRLPAIVSVVRMRGRDEMLETIQRLTEFKWAVRNQTDLAAGHFPW